MHATSGRSSSPAPNPALRGRSTPSGPWAPVAEFLATITPPRVEARLVDVGGTTLESAGTWLPLLSAHAKPAAFLSRPGERARPAGLVIRPLVETAEATCNWDVQRGEPALTVGPTPDVEAALVAG
jgi:hypothetical protein